MKSFYAIAILVAFSRAVLGANVVVFAPAGSATNEGNSSMSPLHTGTLQARFQQVYDASLFAVLPSEGGLITHIVFRTDAAGNEFYTTLPNVEVVVSTTQAAADGLNEVFSANTGLDAKTVLGPGELYLEGLWGPRPPFEPPPFRSQPWSIVFDLRNDPFYYNPQSGNLLLEIRNFGGGVTSPFDAVDVFGDSVSSVFSAVSPTVMPDAGTARTVGLATEFSIQPVPEPSSALLLIVGSVFVWLLRFTRFCSKGRPHVPH